MEATGASVIALDLAALTFIDSAGIRMLIDADRRSRADSERLHLRGVAQEARRYCGSSASTTGSH